MPTNDQDALAAARRMVGRYEWVGVALPESPAADARLVARAYERAVAALKRYADEGNWFATVHVQHDGWRQAIWAWDTMEEPWRIAQAALTTQQQTPSAENAPDRED